MRNSYLSSRIAQAERMRFFQQSCSAYSRFILCCYFFSQADFAYTLRNSLEYKRNRYMGMYQISLINFILNYSVQVPYFGLVYLVIKPMNYHCFNLIADYLYRLIDFCLITMMNCQKYPCYCLIGFLWHSLCSRQYQFAHY